MFILTTKQHVLTCGDNGSVAFGKNMRAAKWFETLESVAEAQRTIDEWHAPYLESKDTTVFEIVLHDDGISGRYHVVTCDGLLGNGEQDSFCPENAQVFNSFIKAKQKGDAIYQAACDKLCGQRRSRTQHGFRKKTPVWFAILRRV